MIHRKLQGVVPSLGSAHSQYGTGAMSGVIVLLVAVTLGGCSGTRTTPINVQTSGNVTVASIKHAACSGGSTVEVSGDLTGLGNGRQSVQTTATILDSKGLEVGYSRGPLLVLAQGQSRSFNFTVTTSGTPTVCRILW